MKNFEEDPQTNETLMAQYPGGMYGEPLDIANGVRFLCSREAKFITGHTLTIGEYRAERKYASALNCLLDGLKLNPRVSDGGLTVQLQEDIGSQQAALGRAQAAKL